MEKAFVHVLRDMLRGERQVKKTSYFLFSSHWGMPSPGPGSLCWDIWFSSLSVDCVSLVHQSVHVCQSVCGCVLLLDWCSVFRTQKKKWLGFSRWQGAPPLKLQLEKVRKFYLSSLNK